MNGKGIKWLAFLAGLILLAALWRWTPLNEFADPRLVGRWLRSLRASSWAIPIVLAAYLVTSLVMFPNTVLNVATVLTFHGVFGVSLAITGSMLATAVFYEIGRRTGKESLSRIGKGRLAGLGRRFRSGGVLGVVTVRLMPIAPFSVVNLVAGACRVPRFDYMAGSLIGLMPGPLLVGIFGRQVRQALKDPGPMSIAMVIGTALLAAVCAYLSRRFVQRRAEPMPLGPTGGRDLFESPAARA